MRARAERLLELLPAAGLDVLLVSELVNVRYLTGYTGSNGLAIVGPRTRAFITDFRYVEQAAAEVHPSFERRRAPRELANALVEVLPSGELRLGFEASHVTVRDYELLREILPARVELVAAGALVEQLRAVKEPEEAERIRAAAALADEAFEGVIAEGLVGRTEREVAMALDWDIRERGGDRPSFETIVAAGAHGARPHARPRDAEIRPGELVVIDWGAVLDGYHSDCTRTLAAGGASDAIRDVYEIVLDAQRQGVGAVRPGADGRAVDALVRGAIDARGYGNEFGHGLGHGVGLDVHEAPRLSQRSDDVLQAGNVLTVEPGIYLQGRFGVRIEDLVLVTEAGRDILTRVSKELTVTA
jgi:Xaa-Pro aminopeptidase